MKKNFNIELPVTKKDVVDFQNSRKCCISDNVFMNGDVKVTDHFTSLENIEALYIEIAIPKLS